jgi:hypothetical protein
MKELVPARALSGLERLLILLFCFSCLLHGGSKTSRSLDIYMSHFSALLLSDHQADGRRMVVAFSWSAECVVDFKTSCLKVSALLGMIDGGR